MAKIEITISGKKYSAEAGETILKVAKENNLKIPTLCHHPDLKPNAACRLCLVEIKHGENWKVVTACNTSVVDKMEIKLDTPRIKKDRKLNLEMLFSDHIQKCGGCNWQYDCQLKKLAAEFGIKKSRFPERRRHFKIDTAAPAISWDSSKCIECGNCLSTCKEIAGLSNIDTNYYSHSIIFGPTGGKSFLQTNCVYCGQCIIRCPSGSLQEKSEIEAVEKLLAGKKKKVLIAQFAPSTRYSIGELFGLPAGENLEKKLVTALRMLGFDYVFDINVGADITTIEEAAEFIERFNEKNLPMFTSCCPAWVRFVELFHPDLIPRLTTTKSPNHCLSRAIKTYFAKKNHLSPAKIKIVTIMPCTSKKYEKTLPELRLGRLPEVDQVLTVREMARMLKTKNIDLPKLDDGEFDNPFGEATGAGAIYGSSGGVMESALRTVVAKLSKGDLEKLEFRDVRGMSGIKESSIEIDDERIEIAVVSGLKNAAKLLKDIDSGVKRYSYIEVMACPGGCLGGGGQPIPTTPEIRKERSAAFYTDDKGKPLRRAHENKELLKMYEELEAKPLSTRAKKMFHRKFKKLRKK